MNTIS